MHEPASSNPHSGRPALKKSQCSMCSRPCDSITSLPCKHCICLSCTARAAAWSTTSSRSISCPCCGNTSELSPELRQALWGPTAASLSIPNRNTTRQINKENLFKAGYVNQVARVNMARPPLFCAACRTGPIIREGASAHMTYCYDCNEFFCDVCANQVHDRIPNGHRRADISVDANGQLVASRTETKGGLLLANVPPEDWRKAGTFAASTLTVPELENAGIHVPRMWHMSEDHAIVDDYKCTSHPTEPVQFWCSSCESIAICAKCCIGNGHHSKHHVMSALEGFRLVRFQIQSYVYPKLKGQCLENGLLKQRADEIIRHSAELYQETMRTLTDSMKTLLDRIEESTMKLMETSSTTFSDIRKDFLQPILKPELTSSDIMGLVITARGTYSYADPVTICSWYAEHGNKLDAEKIRLQLESTKSHLTNADLALRWISERTSIRRSLANCLAREVRAKWKKLSIGALSNQKFSARGIQCPDETVPDVTGLIDLTAKSRHDFGRSPLQKAFAPTDLFRIWPVLAQQHSRSSPNAPTPPLTGRTLTRTGLVSEVWKNLTPSKSESASSSGSESDDGSERSSSNSQEEESVSGSSSSSYGSSE